MSIVIDTNRDCTRLSACLKTSGVSTIIRYYKRGAPTAKVIRRSEAIALSSAGFQLAAVHQRGGRDFSEYGAENGRLDSEAARAYAAETIRQPAASAIYFAVDFDMRPAEYNRHIVPYFEQVKLAMESPIGDQPRYRIGVYGSGFICSRLLELQLVELTWLSQSSGFTGTREFKRSGRWNLLQRLPEAMCGIDVDRNDVNPDNPDFGQFMLDVASSGRGARFTVTARSGLRLRAGPGTEFDQTRLLPFGTQITVLRQAGVWAIVDLEGDGAADGAVHSDFLEPAV